MLQSAAGYDSAKPFLLPDEHAQQEDEEAGDAEVEIDEPCHVTHRPLIIMPLIFFGAPVLAGLIFLFLQSIIAGSITKDEGDGVVDYAWSYDRPDAWTGMCAAGMKQSPIDLVTREAVRWRLEPLVLENYDTAVLYNVTLVNSGHTAKLSVPLSAGLKMSGGGLPHEYYLKQMHLHWGTRDGRGSEHTVNGDAYDMEIHLVHVRAGLDARAAMGEKDGLAVLSVLGRADRLNPAPDDVDAVRLEHALNAVKEAGSRTTVPKLRANMFLPRGRASFYRYEGSLTTPPCSQHVVWTVFYQSKEFSPILLDQLRQLRDKRGGAIDNRRPVQAVNKRRVLLRDVSRRRH